MTLIDSVYSQSLLLQSLRAIPVRPWLVPMIVLGLAIGLSACTPKPQAPVDSGVQAPQGPTDEEFTVQSVPGGASAVFSTGERCTTPCKVTRPSNEPFSITVSKQDYRSATVKVTTNLQALIAYNRKYASSEEDLAKLKVPVERLVPNPATVTLEPEWSR